MGANHVLTSYSTDGMIPLLALVETCIKKGQTNVVLQQYKRYRVSSQRFSHKPLNVELVLIVDTAKSHSGSNAEAICASILHKEESALYQHPERTTATL